MGGLRARSGWGRVTGGGLVVALAVGLLPGLARADTGYVPDPQAFQAAEDWVPPAAAGAYGVTPRVDLSDRLPPVGNQGNLNSCVGWAVGYAFKSAQETLDQRWTADHPSRQFSPGYLWTQLNRGQNVGVPLRKAFDLMEQQGCSTLARLPLRTPTDAPTPEARAEARSFRTGAARALRTGEAIREALRNEYVVVLGIRTDPVFVSGRFDVWTRELRIAAEQEARGNRQLSPHRGHAIVVVGYDDTRRAFRLMNSWGPTWGQQGFCWVSYDLMEQVPNAAADADDLFVLEAWIAEDVIQPLRSPESPAGAVSAVGRTLYAGVLDGRSTWNLTVALAGEPATLATVERVTWRFRTATGQEVEQPSVDGSSSFAAVCRVAGAGTVESRGTVTFRGGRQAEVSYRFEVVAPERTGFELATVDRYLGNFGGRPTWEWTVFVRGDLVDLADVADVTYHLHPTFPEPNRTITETAENGFAHTTSGWGGFRIGATVRFQDGTTRRLEHDLRFHDPVRDQLTLRNGSRFAAFGPAGEPWWFWTAYLDGPLASLRAIQGVVYHLGPTFPLPDRPGAPGPDLQWAISSTAWQPFRLVADIWFTNGTTMRLEHDVTFEPLPPFGAPPAPPDVPRK